MLPQDSLILRAAAKDLPAALLQSEDFRTLCEEAHKREIRVILDGVFSHTGADSVYFNKFGR